MYEQNATTKLGTEILWRPDTTMIIGKHCGFHCVSEYGSMYN